MYSLTGSLGEQILKNQCALLLETEEKCHTYSVPLQTNFTVQGVSWKSVTNCLIKQLPCFRELRYQLQSWQKPATGLYSQPLKQSPTIYNVAHIKQVNVNVNITKKAAHAKRHVSRWCLCHDCPRQVLGECSEPPATVLRRWRHQVVAEASVANAKRIVFISLRVFWEPFYISWADVLPYDLRVLATIRHWNTAAGNTENWISWRCHRTIPLQHVSR